MMENHFRVLATDHHLAIVTQLELRQSNKEIRLKINECLKEYLKVLDDILIEGMKIGEFNQEWIFDLRDTWCLVQLMKLLLLG